MEEFENKVMLRYPDEMDAINDLEEADYKISAESCEAMIKCFK